MTVVFGFEFGIIFSDKRFFGRKNSRYGKMKRNLAVMVKGISLMLLLSLVACTSEPQKEEIETQMKLTKEEALNLVFEHYTDLTDKMVELSFYETEDGRIGYQWRWENIERRPMFLEETHSFVDSQGEIYLFFEVYSDLCDLKGDHYRTEIFQNYAVNMVNGQIIEERMYNELDMWEYSDDFTALFGYEK